jgi:hypothetical protein
MQHLRVLTPLLLAVTACASAGTPSGDDDDTLPPDAPAVPPDAEPITPSPDADPTAPDAMPTTPDANTPPPDACVATTQQLLVNGNVDAACTGSGATLVCPSWTQQPQTAAFPPIVSAAEMPTALQPQSGGRAIWMGGLYASTDAMFQQVTVPATATQLTITGQKWFVTGESSPSTPHDFMRVQIRSTADVVLETVTQWSNADSNTAWTAFTITPTGNYAGQTIRIYLQSQTDADPTPTNTTDNVGNTNFFLDTLSATVLACP